MLHTANTDHPPAPTHTPAPFPTTPQVNAQTSAIGLAATSLYMAAYTWPHREELILQRVRDRGLGLQEVLVLYACFGGE